MTYLHVHNNLNLIPYAIVDSVLIDLYSTRNPYVEIEAVFSAPASHSDEEVGWSYDLGTVYRKPGCVPYVSPWFNRPRFLPSQLVNRRRCERYSQVFVVEPTYTQIESLCGGISYGRCERF